MPVPAVTAVRLTGARHRADLPLLVLGPPWGASATSAWAEAAPGLTDALDVVAWDLPGHGHNRAVPEEPYTLAELAAGVLAVVDEILLGRDDPGGSFSYAGVGLGGAVGLQLLLDLPGRVRDAVVVDADPHAGDATAQGGPLGFDVRDRLDAITAPLLVVTGPADVARVVRSHVLGEPADGGDALADLEDQLRAALDGGVSVADVEALLRRLAGPDGGTVRDPDPGGAE